MVNTRVLSFYWTPYTDSEFRFAIELFQIVDVTRILVFEHLTSVEIIEMACFDEYRPKAICIRNAILK